MQQEQITAATTMIATTKWVTVKFQEKRIFFVQYQEDMGSWQSQNSSGPRSV